MPVRFNAPLEDAASTVSGQYGRSMSNVWASLIVQIDGPPMVGDSSGPTKS